VRRTGDDEEDEEQEEEDGQRVMMLRAFPTVANTSSFQATMETTKIKEERKKLEAGKKEQNVQQSSNKPRASMRGKDTLGRVADG
jgi:hypothetical protein